IDLGPRVALAHQHGAGGDALDARPRRAPHELFGERALEGGLDRSDERVGILVTPGAVTPERLAVPVAEIRQPRLLREPAVSVVHPVARERTGTRERR